MLKKLIFISFIFLCLSNSYAMDTCPTKFELRSNQLRGWNAFTDENGSPLSQKELKEFEQTVATFTYARWIPGALEGASHCYYYDKTGEFSFAFLSKANLKPDMSDIHWKIYGDEAECIGNEKSCRFIS